MAEGRCVAGGPLGDSMNWGPRSLFPGSSKLLRSVPPPELVQIQVGAALLPWVRKPIAFALGQDGTSLNPAFDARLASSSSIKSWVRH